MDGRARGKADGRMARIALGVIAERLYGLMHELYALMTGELTVVHVGS